MMKNKIPILRKREKSIVATKLVSLMQTNREQTANDSTERKNDENKVAYTYPTYGHYMHIYVI